MPDQSNNNKISEDDLKGLFREKANDPHEDNWDFGEEIKVRNKARDVAVKKIRKKIKRMENYRPKPKSSFLDSFLIFTAVSGIAGFVIFLLMNFGSFYANLRWWYYTDYLNQSLPEAKNEQAVATRTPLAYVAKTPVPLPAKTVTATPKPTPVTFTSPTLKIPKLGEDVPVNIGVLLDDVLSSLENGVSQIQGTALPGEGGNIFIVGHSSNYPWAPGNYNTVFALLDKLVVGDDIFMDFEGKEYHYKMIDKFIVKPDQVEVLDNSNEEILSLMTCYPVGTTLNRLIVQAKLTV